MNSDEWLIAIVISAIVLPDILLAAVVCGVSIFVLCHPSRRSRLAAQPAFYPALFMLPVILLPAIISGYTTGIIYGTVMWLMLVFMVYVSSVATLWFISNIMDLLLLISVVSAVVGVAHIALDIRFLGRISSIYENPNYYGYAIEIFILAAIYQYMHKEKPVYIVLAIGNAACNIMCDCRTAWVAILVSTTLLIFLKIRKVWVLGIMAAAAMLFIVVIQFVPSLAPRFSLAMLERSFANRTIYWGNAAEWISERPVLGYGMGSYSMLSEQTGERVLVHAHNMVLNILLDFGIVGMLALLVLAGFTLKEIMHRKENEKLENYGFLTVAVIAATLIHGITDVPVFGVTSALMLVTILGCTGCLQNDIAVKRANKLKSLPVNVSRRKDNKTPLPSKAENNK